METQPVSAFPTPTDRFTNFTEISYEKTRDSYDFSEVPHRSYAPHSLPIWRFAEWAEMG